MEELIRCAQRGILNFFTENLHDMKSVYSFRLLLKFYSLELASSGVTEINMKHGCRHSFLIAADKDESEMVIVVFKHSLYEDEDVIAVYCVSGEAVYECVSTRGRSYFNLEEWAGREGFIAINMANDFRSGKIDDSLRKVTEGVGYDIVEFTRNLSLS